MTRPPTRPVMQKMPRHDPFRDQVFAECDTRMYQSMSAVEIVAELQSTGPMVGQTAWKLTPIVLAWLQLQNVRPHG